MSGWSDSGVCPNCDSERYIMSGENRPFDMVSSNCLDCGFYTFTHSGIADLEEVCFSFTNKHNSRLRIATKYPNLSNEFLFSKGVTQYKLVNSIGSTEIYPFTGSSEIITDITSTGKTLEDNNLRVLKDGIILKSEACLLMSKKKGRKIRPFLNTFIGN